jgi:hypothetical protein
VDAIGLVVLGAVLGWAASHFLPGVWTRLTRRPPLRLHVEPDPDISMAGYPNWDDYSFWIPRNVAQIGEPPSSLCREWWKWARSMDGVDVGLTPVRLMLIGLSDTDVVVDALQVQVLRRYDNPPGTIVVCATGGADIIPRHIAVDLDSYPPMTDYRDSDESSLGRFLFSLSKGETEIFYIWARVTQGTCDWIADLQLLVNGKRQAMRIDDAGRPFRTTAPIGAERFYWESGQWQPWPPAGLRG